MAAPTATFMSPLPVAPPGPSAAAGFPGFGSIWASVAPLDEVGCDSPRQPVGGESSVREPGTPMRVQGINSLSPRSLQDPSSVDNGAASLQGPGSSKKAPRAPSDEGAGSARGGSCGGIDGEIRLDMLRQIFEDVQAVRQSQQNMEALMESQTEAARAAVAERSRLEVLLQNLEEEASHAVSHDDSMDDVAGKNHAIHGFMNKDYATSSRFASPRSSFLSNAQKRRDRDAEQQMESERDDDDEKCAAAGIIPEDGRGYGEKMCKVNSKHSKMSKTSRHSHANGGKKSKGNKSFAARRAQTLTDYEMGHKLRHKHQTEDEQKRHSGRRFTSIYARAVKQGTLNYCQRIAYHPYFEAVSAGLIILHSLFIGAYVEHQASHGQDVHPVIGVGNQLLVVVFLFEVGIKVSAEGCHEFIFGEEGSWNLFDTLLVVLIFVEASFAILDKFAQTTVERDNMKTILKLGEIIRMARVLRIFRVLRLSSALRDIIAKVLNSMKTLFWILVLITLLLFVVAVCVTHGANQWLKEHDDKSYAVGSNSLQAEDVTRSYGSVATSIFTLLKAITGGESWGTSAQTLLRIHWLYGGIFVGYIVFSIFALLNIITGIFVDVAYQNAKQERDLISEAQIRMEEASAEHLREVFVEMDEEDGSGLLSKERFRICMTDERVKSYMLALKINTNNADMLFRMLDVDDSGNVVIDEFVEGCMKLKGEAKSMDVHILLCETRHAIGHLYEFMDYCEERLHDIDFQLRHQKRVSSVAMGLIGKTTQGLSLNPPAPPGVRSGLSRGFSLLDVPPTSSRNSMMKPQHVARQPTPPEDTHVHPFQANEDAIVSTVPIPRIGNGAESVVDLSEGNEL